MPTNDDRRAAEARAAKIRRARELIAGNGIPGLALTRVLNRLDAMIVAVLDTETEHRTCPDCGELFSLSPSEAAFYDSKGWGYPRRCETCRRSRRHHEIARAQAPPY